MIYSLIRSLFISHWFLFQAFSSSFFWKNGVTMKKTVLTTEILDYKISRLVSVLNLIHRKYQIENCSHHWLFLVLQNKLNGKISHFSHWECSDKRDCMSQNVKRDERWNCLITVRWNSGWLAVTYVYISYWSTHIQVLLKFYIKFTPHGRYQSHCAKRNTTITEWKSVINTWCLKLLLQCYCSKKPAAEKPSFLGSYYYISPPLLICK